MAFGQNPTTSTQSALATNQFPIGSVAVPGNANGDLTALEGGPISTDSNGNKTAPASMYVKDGNNVTFGTTTDAAATSDTGTFSFMALVKRLLAKFPSIGQQNKAGSMSVTIASDQATQVAPLYQSLAVGTPLAPYGSNPTQTAASGGDTQYKFGAGGATSGNHLVMQNNGTVNVSYAFDQSTTTAGNMVYTMTPGQYAFWDRTFTVMHVSSPSQINFGGTTGLTIEAFA